jgi:hypothetical protein
MKKKLMLSIVAALAVSLAGGVARADSPQKGSDKSSSAAKDLDDAEEGTPYSLQYRNRKTSNHSPTNDEIYAGESENPHSVDYANRKDKRFKTSKARPAKPKDQVKSQPGS